MSGTRARFFFFPLFLLFIKMIQKFLFLFFREVLKIDTTFIQSSLLLSITARIFLYKMMASQKSQFVDVDVILGAFFGTEGFNI